MATVSPWESPDLGPCLPDCSTVSTAKKTPEIGALKPAATPAWSKALNPWFMCVRACEARCTPLLSQDLIYEITNVPKTDGARVNGRRAKDGSCTLSQTRNSFVRVGSRGGGGGGGGWRRADLSPVLAMLRLTLLL